MGETELHFYNEDLTGLCHQTMELVEDCKHDAATESDPGTGIKTALIRAGSKLEV